MSEVPSDATATTIARHLGHMLGAMGDELSQDGRFELLLIELGIPPDHADSVATAVGDELGAAGQALAEVTTQLTALLEESDSDARAAKTPGLLLEIATAIDAVHDLSEAARGALPDDLDTSAGMSGAVDALGERALPWLVVTWLRVRHPVLTAALTIAGVVEVTPIDTDPDEPPLTARRLHLHRLGPFLTDPAAALADRYGWGEASGELDASLLLDLDALLSALRVPAALDLDRDEIRVRSFTLAIDHDRDPSALHVRLDLEDATGIDFELSDEDADVDVRLRTEGSLQLGSGVRIDPPFEVSPTDPTGTVDGSLTWQAERVASLSDPATSQDPDDPDDSAASATDLVLLGDASGTRLTAQRWSVAAGLAFGASTDGVSASAAVRLQLENGTIVLALGGDGFLAEVLPGELRLPVSLDLTFDRDGLHVTGDTGLEVAWSPAATLGPITLDQFTFTLLVGDEGIGVAGRAVAGLTLGPFQATVSGVGAAVELAFEPGNLGPLDLRAQFLPPTGIGLRLDASVITGGGHIERSPDGTRYSGALELELAGIGISAIGLLDTQLPDGSDGYSLLVVIQASFPPIALPFGFTLTGVGGIVGLNRSIDVDLLRERFASGTVGRILAPEDPVGNAPALIEELGEVFPATAGTVVVGPTLQLGWSAFVRFDLGVFIELPGPTRVVLLGSVRAVIEDPSGRPVLKLRLDVIGELDLVKRSLSFDAVLVDSQLLEVFELTGGAAFRLYWGDTPNVVLSVGGFHPRFDPAPLSFPPSLQRVAMTRGRRADRFYLRFEGYLAVTTNSLQFGAAAEVVLRASRFVAEGSFAFDVLIRTDPFRFELDLRASLRISYRGRTLAGVKISGALSGPGPVDFTGRLEFKILFVTISWRGSFQLGDASPPTVPTIDDLAAELLPELEDPANLSAAGSDPSVIIEPDDAPVGMAFVLPSSRLTWQQRRAPLHLRLERLDGAPLADPTLAWVTANTDTTEVTDWFAPGRYLELSDAERVDREAYELADAGLGLDLGEPIVAREREADRAPKELIVSAMGDDAEDTEDEGKIRTFAVWLQDAACGRTPTPSRPAPAIGVRRLTMQVRDERDASVLATASTVAQAHQQVRYEHAGAVVVLADDLRPTPEL